MQFENRIPDEHVNYTREHPLKEFAWLVTGVLGTLFVLTLLIGFFAGELAAYLPYRYEKDFAKDVGAHLQTTQTSAQAKQIELELNRLAARLTTHMTLPEGMQITVHYQEAPEVNAFATLGGNIVVFKGLLERMPDENTLAMVLAHEIAHAQLRHPARSLGRGLAVGVVLSTVSSSLGRNAAGSALNTAGQLSLLKYSRDQERAADANALQALAALYQHVGGARDLFRLLHDAAGQENLRLTMLSTHPLSQERIENLSALASQQQWPGDGPRTPLTFAPLLQATPR